MTQLDRRILLGNWIAPEACLGALVAEDVVVFQYKLESQVRPPRIYSPQVTDVRTVKRNIRSASSSRSASCSYPRY